MLCYPLGNKMKSIEICKETSEYILVLIFMI